MGVSEDGTSSGQLIQMRRRDFRGSIQDLNIAGAHIISENQKDIRFLLRKHRRAQARADHQNTSKEIHHEILYTPYIRRLVERDLITQGIQHMQLLVTTILLSFTLLGLGQAPPAFRFQIDTLHEGIPQPMHLEYGPDGKIYFIEIAGKLQRLDLKSKSLTTLGEVVITNDQENGLIGMTLDPDFLSNQWIYLYHSPVDFKGQILSRFTITADKLDHASRIDILKVDEQRNQCCHHGGTIRFGRDGNLFISTGDNTQPLRLQWIFSNRRTKRPRTI